MLCHVSIKDFAIIEDVNIEFKPGLNVLTGETGAGKSILVEAMNMALGGRADSSFIRSNCEKAYIEICGTVSDETKKTLLDSQLEDDGDIYILRELQASGKSISRVNGTLVNLSVLNSISKSIADIHGQYDNQSLLNPESHLILLDKYGGSSVDETLIWVKDIFEKYDKAKSQLNKLLSIKDESERTRDFMTFELNEIKNANLLLNEDESLTEQLNILKNAELLSSALNQTYELLFRGDGSALDKLSLSMHEINEIKDFSTDYGELYTNISSTFYSLEDLQDSIRTMKESVVFSAEAINETQERLDLIERLKKKYGPSIEKILFYKGELEEKLSQIENSENLIEQAKMDLTKIENELKEASNKLNSLRNQAAKKMEKDMEKELGELNFKDTELLVSIEPVIKNGKIEYTAIGSDFVEFMIITNKGEKPKPLAKIASGGEISRIMLAFKKILGDFDHIPSLIFDEIDSGISGATASIVGQKLKEISKTHQIICITHLAQIAAFADHHYQIYKEESQGRTISSIKPLNQEERIQEIARLLGGLHITDTTLENAKELLSQSS